MQKIRVVIDTNTFVSGIISPKGTPRKILELARKEVFEVVTSSSRKIILLLYRLLPAFRNIYIANYSDF